MELDLSLHSLCQASHWLQNKYGSFPHCVSLFTVMFRRFCSLTMYRSASAIHSVQVFMSVGSPLSAVSRWSFARKQTRFSRLGTAPHPHPPPGRSVASERSEAGNNGAREEAGSGSRPSPRLSADGPGRTDSGARRTETAADPWPPAVRVRCVSGGGGGGGQGCGDADGLGLTRGGRAADGAKLSAGGRCSRRRLSPRRSPMSSASGVWLRAVGIKRIYILYLR